MCVLYQRITNTIAIQMKCDTCDYIFSHFSRKPKKSNFLPEVVGPFSVDRQHVCLRVFVSVRACGRNIVMNFCCWFIHYYDCDWMKRPFQIERTKHRNKNIEEFSTLLFIIVAHTIIIIVVVVVVVVIITDNIVVVQLLRDNSISMISISFNFIEIVSYFFFSRSSHILIYPFFFVYPYVYAYLYTIHSNKKRFCWWWWSQWILHEYVISKAMHSIMTGGTIIMWFSWIDSISCLKN